MPHVRILIVITLLTQGLFGQTHAVSMADSIQTALTKNPRTQANTLRLESAYESLRSSKKSLFSPNLSIGYTDNTDFSAGIPQSGGASISINLFNGLSDYYRVKAQECNYKKLEATYNSTTAMSQNSNGQIAGLVANYFINLVSARESITFTENILAQLKKLETFAKTNEQKVNIAAATQASQISVEELRSKLEISESNYHFAVTQAASTQLDSLLETINHISIPTAPEQASEISLQKSPEIQSARLNIECMKLSNKATKGQAYGFRADLRAGVNTNFNGTTSPGATLSISKSLGLGTKSNLKSEQKAIEAAELDLNGLVAEVNNTLKNNYIQLRSAATSAAAYEKGYQQNSQQFDSLLKKGTALSEEEITIALSLINTYQGQWQLMNYKFQELINIKFQIQKSIGTLFEANNVVL